MKSAKKKNRKKRGLTSLLALCLAVSSVIIFPLERDTVKADEGEMDIWVEDADGQGNGYWYHELEGGGVEITSFTEPSGGEESDELVEITVPSKLEGKNVVRIGVKAFDGTAGYCRERIRKITIPQGVTSIGGGAFQGCRNLEELILPKGITNIEYDAFEGCSSLKQLVLPDSLTSIEKGMISGCSSLTEITIPKGVTSIASRALSCGGLTAIHVEEENPFYASQDGILYNKDKTSLLCCPGGVSGTFTIPDNTEEIGNDAFVGCSGLTDITITGNVERIGDWAFSSLPLTQVVVPGNVKIIGEFAFSFCYQIEKIILEEGIETIGSNAFLLASIEKEIEGVTIPASVTSLGNDIFGGCISLPSIQVDDGNKTYASEDGILYNKDKTTMLICPEGKSGEALIPASVTDIDCFTLLRPCEKITAIKVDPGNVVYSSEEGVMYNKDKTVLLFCPKAKISPSEVRIIVPDTVQSIAEEAFAHDSGWGGHVTLVCYEGSPAQKYAEEHGMLFEASRRAYTYIITFDANGGTNAGGVSLSVTEGKTIRDMGLQLPAANRAGYDFLGWYTSRSGGSQVTPETKFTGSQTVYAQWERQSFGDGSQPAQPGSFDDAKKPAQSGDNTQQTDKYTVTFHKNGGGKVSQTKIKVAKGQKIGKLPTAQRKGYNFLGWYTAKKGGTKITTSTEVTKSQTAYAQWKKVGKPKKAGKPSLKSQRGGQLTVSYGKIRGVKGYEICYSTKKNFKGAGKLTTSKTKATIKKLRKKTVYYVRIRAYRLDSTNGKIYGGYGAFRKLKTK